MSAYAASTSRIKLGQMCTAMGYRNPVYLAKVAATADIISGGRVQMGIGGGWYEHEWKAYGYGFPSAGVRLGMLDEGVRIMRDAWRDGRVSLERQALSGRWRHRRAEAVAGGRASAVDRGRRREGDAAHRREVRAVHELHVRARRFRSQVADPGRPLPMPSAPTIDAIVRSANFNAVIGTSETDVKERIARLRAQQVAKADESAVDAMMGTISAPEFCKWHNGTGRRETHAHARTRLRVRHHLLPGGRVRPHRNRAVRARGHPRAGIAGRASGPRWRSGPAGGSAFGSTGCNHVRGGRRIEVPGRRWPAEGVVPLRQRRPARVIPLGHGTAGRRIGQRLVSGWQLRCRTGSRRGRGRFDIAGLHGAAEALRILGHVPGVPQEAQRSRRCPARTAGWRSAAPAVPRSAAARAQRPARPRGLPPRAGPGAALRPAPAAAAAAPGCALAWVAAASAPKPITTPASAIFATCRVRRCVRSCVACVLPARAPRAAVDS